MFEKLLKWLRGLLNQLFDDAAGGQDILISSRMENALPLWVAIYECGCPWCSEKRNIHSLCLGPAIAQEFSRLVTMESEITCTGSARASWLMQQARPFLDALPAAVETACALGGCAFKPYVQDDRIVVDVVQEDCFFPTTFDTSGRMTGAIFTEQIKRRNAIYTRLEHHEFRNGTETIQNRAFVSATSAQLGREIPLTAVPEWADIAPEAKIDNITQPLFAYFKVPTANRVDRHSPLGASVYALAVDTIRDADVQYGSLLWEYRGGELAIDVDAAAIRQDPDGALRMEERDRRLYRHLLNGNPNMWNTFSPALRDASYLNGLDAILRRIEFQCGLAYGTISNPQSVEKTAEEVRASKQRSYATVRLIQQALQDAIEGLFYAMDVYATLYGLAPAGAYELAFDWDDSIVNDPAARKQQFWQYVEAGRFPFERYLVEFEGYSEEEAAQIAAQAAVGTDTLTFGSLPPGDA